MLPSATGGMHSHSQSVFTGSGEPNSAGLNDVRRRGGPRQASMDFAGSLPLGMLSPTAASASAASSSAAAAQAQQTPAVKKAPRSTIVASPSLSSLAPLQSRGEATSPMARVALDSSSGGGGGGSPTSDSDMGSQSQPQTQRKMQGLRPLSPLGKRQGALTPNATSSLSGTPRIPASNMSPGTSGGGSSGGGSVPNTSTHISFASSSLNSLVPTQSPSHATPMPLASGVLVALHVGGLVFVTTPETLMRAQTWEVHALSAAGGAGRAMLNRSSEQSLLQWIAEDALAKHREGEGGGSSPSKSFSLGQLSSSASTSSLQVSRANRPGVGSPSDASPRLSSSLPAGSVSSTVHHSVSASSATLPFHAETYNYFIDRSPLAYPLILQYCRDGGDALKRSLLTSAPAPGAGIAADAALLSAARAEADYLSLSALSAVLDSVQVARDNDRLLDSDDRFWADVCRTIDAMFPLDSTTGGSADGGADAAPWRAGTVSPSNGPSDSSGRPISPLSRMGPSAIVAVPTSNGTRSSVLQRHSNLQRNIGAMLRRLAFSRDPLLRVCHASYHTSPEYEERLLEILHTTCTLCKRTIYYRPIGLREGRDTGCPAHPPGGQWDRKQRMWTCCGSPDFKDSGCQFTGIHYTTWTFWNSD